MIFQIEKQAGKICDNGVSYRPSFTISKKEGMIPPEKYMGISKNIFRAFLPISFL